ncbi:alpha/beta hydrolase [Pseudoclavibacter sp. 13-3]|uniref:alpha/beta hydrolase n=1 Tax=Pseudoclavibacter sp. 13-3 TaxID=2901228 RepID=UPI001E653EAD|nr:alpha/beta hydrolase [Pseudoclavibacter sp. 13-3]MCD7100635.1 alpha/beta hydrolase [Pseudoclavibacter sp. 13-3]
MSDSAVRPTPLRSLVTLLGMLTAVLLSLVLVMALSFVTTPIPGALLIRSSFNAGGVQGNEALAPFVPTGVTRDADLAYTSSGRPDERLDVYRRADATAPASTIIWVHGGGWVGGDKSQGENYSRILAASGATVVQINYTLSPEARFPTAVQQLDAATTYLLDHADDLGIATDRLFYAGDSAGSQVVSTYLAAVASPDQASRLAVRPRVHEGEIKGAVLFCGAYDVTAVRASGQFASFLNTVMWAYSGVRDWQSAEVLRQGSPIDSVTAGFPAAFVSAGNGDPLESQSRAFAARLQQLGVPVVTQFYDEDHEPALPHEYQVLFSKYHEAISATRAAVQFVSDHGGSDVDADRVPVLAAAR